jgi:cysteine desulfurase family protein (TIGR01976 family)
MLETAALPDVAAIRARFPALAREQDGRPVVFFDNPAGTQVPQETIDGVTRYFQSSNANTGGSFRTSRETDELILAARRETAAFLGASSPDEIVFGPNMTTLAFQLSHALGRVLREGDEIVTTRLEHDANVSPWLALRDRGITVRFIDFHPEDTSLDFESAAEAIGPRTRLVAAGYASNALGTVNDVRRIADMAHAAGALVFIDAVHFGPHGPIDVSAIGADLLACSAYKFFGPHAGILWGRHDVLETLPASHVRLAGEQPPGSWETGTGNHEALAGLLGTFAYLRSLLPESSNRREHYRRVMSAIQRHERTLAEKLIGGLQSLPGCRVLGITDPARFGWRVPTASFVIAGHEPEDVAETLGRRGIYSWAGDHYTVEPLARLGLDSTNRVGLTHYNTPEEIDRFIAALAEITG